MKRNRIKDLIKKAIVEVIMEAPATPTIIHPPTKPQTPPAPIKPKPNSPLQPRPVIRPKPKATLSHDVKLFIKSRQGGMKEAIDIGDYPDFINPEKKASIESEVDYVENILPDLGPNADKYLELITGESYKRAIDQAARYLGTTIDGLHQKFPNLHSAYAVLVFADQKVSALERNHTPQLEKLAIKTVLDLEEYKLIKDLVKTGKIKIDCKLDKPNLNAGLAEDELDKPANENEEGGLTIQEKIDAQLYSINMGESEGKLRRALANLLTQGDAINKFFLYNTVNEILEQIDPALPNTYGMLFSTSLVLNYWQPNEPFTRNWVDSNAVGSEEVVPEENGVYTIKVRGRNFPLLIHELVKGINEYLALDVGSQEEMDTEKLSDEMRQFLVGPGLDLRLRKLIPTEKSKLIPLIKKLLYKLSIEDIKSIFLGGNRAQLIMRNLIKTAEQLSQDYEKGGEEEPPAFSGGEQPNWK